MSDFKIKLIYQTNVPNDVKQLIEKARDRWLQIVTGGYEPFEEADGTVWDRLIIDVSIGVVDAEKLKLAVGGLTKLNPISRRPLRSKLVLDEYELPDLRHTPDFLYDVILHEFGHAIGIDKFLWDLHKVYDLKPNGTPVLKGKFCRKEYQSLLGRHNPIDLPLFKDDGALHIDEATFPTEIMSPGISSGGNKLSRLSVAMLADIGYDVDFLKADEYELERAWKEKGIPKFICGHTFHEPEIAVPKTQNGNV